MSQHGPIELRFAPPSRRLKGFVAFKPAGQEVGMGLSVALLRLTSDSRRPQYTKFNTRISPSR